ncbi:hypothetical protein B0T17DRAFT_488910 [Bombardia bombarda]|uniref:C2H2-type domain-containing protein n=1 Tax=Bombardia bombarda TaxID=252184 RepID=A0AA40C8F7_9PEZI|nr:hypothetical protein B0T17DRAFT_488910 [Bombardia bombarda]
MPASEIADHIVVKPKRFQCFRCQRVFARLEHLQRHERTHTQERPFQCVQCDSRFTRSDLLIRHERLSHNKDGGKPVAHTTAASPLDEDRRPTHPQKKTKRPRTYTTGSNDLRRPEPPLNAVHRRLSAPSAQISPTISANSNFGGLPLLAFTDQDVILPLATLDATTSPLTSVELSTEHVEVTEHASATTGADPTGVVSLSLNPSDTSVSPSYFNDIEDSFHQFSALLQCEPQPSYHFTSLLTTEQPMTFFSLDSFIERVDAIRDITDTPICGSHIEEQVSAEEPPTTTISRFGSRLPSPCSQVNHNLGPGASTQPINNSLSHISSKDRELLLDRILEFTTTISPTFKLPSRLSLARYIRAYINGFHEHLPFLHIASMSVQNSCVELLLAMAAVGAQYCFEGEKGVELFHAARAITTERVRQRDARVASKFNRGGHQRLGEVEIESSDSHSNGEDLMQSAQALLILMAMATWAKHTEILREALAIQSILASIVRDSGLSEYVQSPVSTEDCTETGWVHFMRDESVKRTKFVVFCFFNLHCIVYDIPPLILNSEINMQLPCSATEFKADTPAKWHEAKMLGGKPVGFQDALRGLFTLSSHGNHSHDAGSMADGWHSSLGNYILIHAIIQQIFMVRQTARCRFNVVQHDHTELTAEDVSPLETALCNWQLGWERSPESSLDPTDPNGPVAFNSTALLRLAYIRLTVDTGPGRALGTRDPSQIAKALRDMPGIKRTPRIVRALLHAAHALSIPVKIGVRLVARTQTFIWSIQHSLCSLECALLLSKWLEAVSISEQSSTESTLTGDERRILCIVKTMLDETEFAIPEDLEMGLADGEMAKLLSPGVLRVWATIFKGAQTWAMVDVIGSSLDIYAGIVEAS